MTQPVRYTITLTFQSGTDADIAQVQVQNKLAARHAAAAAGSTATGRISVEKGLQQLPDGCRRYQHQRHHDAGGYLRLRWRQHERCDQPYVSGVGDVQLFGSQYAMRIWMDPNKLNNYQLTPVDVISAIKAQNAQVAAGQLGGTPPVKGQQLNASIIAQTRLTNPLTNSAIFC